MTHYERIQKQERRADEGSAGGPENLAFGIIGQSDAGAGGEVQKGLRALAAVGKKNEITMVKDKNTVEYNGKLFKVERLGSNVFIPAYVTNNERPEKEFISSIARNAAEEIGRAMLADGAIKVEIGPEFDEDTGKLKGYLVAVRTTPILYPITKSVE